MEKQNISLTNAILMISLITFWGSSFVIVKAILKEGLSPIAVATFRFLLAGILFLIVVIINRIKNPKYTTIIEKKDIKTIIILALSGVTIFFIAQYTGIKMANASIASILVCLLSPILISLLSAKIFKEKLSKKQLLGITTAAIGTATVILGGTPNLETNFTFLLGSLILLSTPLLWTTYTLIGKNIMKKYNPFLIVSYVNIIGGLFLIPFSLAENSFKTILTLTNQEWLAISYLAITCSVLGYFIWFHVMKQTNASTTSSFLFAEPLITVIFASILIKEEITIFIISGGFLILAGLYLITIK